MSTFDEPAKYPVPVPRITALRPVLDPDHVPRMTLSEVAVAFAPTLTALDTLLRRIEFDEPTKTQFVLDSPRDPALVPAAKTLETLHDPFPARYPMNSEVYAFASPTAAEMPSAVFEYVLHVMARLG